MQSWILYSLLGTAIYVVVIFIDKYNLTQQIYVIQKEDGSKVLFLLQLVPVFVLILSMIFLKEPITVKKLLGFALILIPSLLASSEGNKLKLSIDKNTILLLLPMKVGVGQLVD